MPFVGLNLNSRVPSATPSEGEKCAIIYALASMQVSFLDERLSAFVHQSQSEQLMLNSRSVGLTPRQDCISRMTTNNYLFRSDHAEFYLCR